MAEMAKIANELKTKVKVFDFDLFRNELANKEQIWTEEQARMCKDLKADVDCKNAPILDEIHGIKTDMNTMKMNIIATGQLEAGFSTE